MLQEGQGRWRESRIRPEFSDAALHISGKNFNRLNWYHELKKPLKALGLVPLAPLSAHHWLSCSA